MSKSISKITPLSNLQLCQHFDQLYQSVRNQLHTIQKQLSLPLNGGELALLESQLDQLETEISEMEVRFFESKLKKFQLPLSVAKNFHEVFPNPEKRLEVLSYLLKQYNEQVQSHLYFGIIKVSEDIKYFYEADYDGRSEKGKHGLNSPAGLDFTGETFIMPTFQEAMAWFQPDQLREYQEMLDQDLQPELQLTPLAKTLLTLAKHLDARKEDINIKVGHDLLSQNTAEKINKPSLDESTLIYEPVEISLPKQSIHDLIITKGLSKSELIQKYHGWLVEFVSMRPELPEDSDKRHNDNGLKLSNAEKIVKYRQKNRGLGYENYLVAQMKALFKPKYFLLDSYSDDSGAEHQTCLPESICPTEHGLSFGMWSCGRVLLGGTHIDAPDSRFRFRRAIRGIRPNPTPSS